MKSQQNKQESEIFSTVYGYNENDLKINLNLVNEKHSKTHRTFVQQKYSHFFTERPSRHQLKNQPNKTPILQSKICHRSYSKVFPLKNQYQTFLKVQRNLEREVNELTKPSCSYSSRFLSIHNRSKSTQDCSYKFATLKQKVNEEEDYSTSIYQKQNKKTSAKIQENMYKKTDEKVYERKYEKMSEKVYEELSFNKFKFASPIKNRQNYEPKYSFRQTKDSLKELNDRNQKLLSEIKKTRLQISQRGNFLESPDTATKNNCNYEASQRLKNIGSFSLDSLAITYQTQIPDQSDMKNQSYTISNQNFFILKRLGSGKFSTVYLAVDKESGLLVSLKKIKQSLLLENKKYKDQLIMEIKIQMFVDHPNILKMYGVYFDREQVTLILEYMQEGDLYKALTSKKKFTQSEVSQRIFEVLFALNYLQENRIVHRDIKPQNIVVSHNISKLSDFGTATICQNTKSSLCGTLDYNAPQIFGCQQYDLSLDIWGVGVLTFQLLTGKPPFYNKRKRQTIKKITEYRDGEVQYPENISIQAISFIAKFLVKDPSKRISIENALNHQFITIYNEQQIKQLHQGYLGAKRKLSN